MNNILHTSIILAKNEEQYFLSNVNYVHSSKEELFSIINNNKFIFRQINNAFLLDTLFLPITDIIEINGPDFDGIEWLDFYQKETLKSFYNGIDNPSEDLKLIRLKISTLEQKNTIKKIFHTSSILDDIQISDVYHNILNIQDTDYFDFLQDIILLTDDLFMNDIMLNEFNNKEDDKEFGVLFKTITRNNLSFLNENNELELNKNSTVLTLIPIQIK